MSREAGIALRRVGGWERTDPELPAPRQLGCRPRHRLAHMRHSGMLRHPEARAGAHRAGTRVLCARGARVPAERGGCALCWSPAEPPARRGPGPGALPSAGLQAGGGLGRPFKGWGLRAPVQPEARARRGGERSRSAPGFGVPSSRHLWPPSLRQVVQRTAPRLLERRPPARSLPHHRHPVPLLEALLCAPVGPKPLLRPPPQTKLNGPWNRRPHPHLRTPAPTGSLRPAEVELAGGEGAAVTKRWGELMSQRSKVPPSTEESGSTSGLCRAHTALPKVQAGTCLPLGGLPDPPGSLTTTCPGVSRAPKWRTPARPAASGSAAVPPPPRTYTSHTHT